jgi:hypothetical protein
LALYPRRCSTRVVLSAVGLGTAATLCMVLPSRAQQDRPELHFSAPATRAAGSQTPVDLDFTLPAGFQLTRPARVRVVDEEGRLIELLPVFITRRAPAWKGTRGLHTENYLPGIYKVSAELIYVHPRLGPGTVATPPVTLTIPAEPVSPP